MTHDRQDELALAREIHAAFAATGAPPQIARGTSACAGWPSATRGAVLTLAQLQRLAAAWYGDRLRGDWRPRTPEESQAVLSSAGLTGEFWQLRSP